ncbi:MAG: AMP-binding protein, partial [Nevskiales bacterium]
MARSSYEAQIREVLASQADAPAIDFDGELVSWRDVRAIIAALEGLIDQAGVPEFARIGLIARNRPAHYAALWGAFVSGRCASMIHAFQPVAALAQDLAANRFPIVLGERRDWTEQTIAAADAAGSVGYAYGQECEPPFVRVTVRGTPASDLLAPPDSDTVVELLSSGTTGKPKRIPLSRTAIDELIERTCFQFGSGGAGQNAPQLLAWPLTSLGGTNGALPAVALGQLLAIQEKFEPHGFLEQLRRYRPTFLSIPPAAMAMLLQLKPLREDLSSIQLYFNGAAPLDPNVRTMMEEEYGMPVANAYGATEFAGIISSWVPEDFALLKEKRGSCGRALPGIQQRIVAQETGEVLGPMQVGLVEALVPRVSDDWVRT